MTLFELHLFGITLAPTYYGLMYAIGFILGYQTMRYFHIFRLPEHLEWTFIAVFLGVILGGRLGYILFYNPVYFWAHPAEIIATWKGGMSFHGGALGVLVALIWAAKHYGYRVLFLTDAVALIAPIGIMLGRFGNYINGELLGFAPYYGIGSVWKDGIPHFPSTLLEALLEWPVLFIFTALAWRYRAKFSSGIVFGVFVFGYGIARMIAEFFRLPDAGIGYLFGTQFITMGHVLSFPMVIVGAGFIIYTIYAGRTR